MKNDCELLAPAGSFAALKAAVNAGADAVYLAGTHFGARAFAANFSADELKEAIIYAHLRGVAVHVTVNTLVFDEELAELADYLRFLDAINVDAVLLQDLGAAALAKKIVPNLPLHASTQMTATNLSNVLALAELGFSRVVLARELTLAEIRHITKHSPIEIEIFMHGALCVCYSGQCYMSSHIFGRSANRGRCAQPCRLPYTLTDAKGHDLTAGKAGKYLLSPRDLNTLDILPQLVGSGVASLKIEGRMKRPEYVATVTDVYRRALDKVFAAAKSPAATDDAAHFDRNDQNALAQVFNRDFTHAFLTEEPLMRHKNRRALMSDLRPNNRGLAIGRVTKFIAETHTATVKLNSGVVLNVGDEVDFWVKVGGRVTAKIDDLIENNGKNSPVGGREVSFVVGERVNVGDRVFKVFDAALTKKARQFFGEKNERRIPLTVYARIAPNCPLELTLTDADGNSVVEKTHLSAQTALNRPLAAETIRQQVERLGTSIFALNDFSADVAEGIMLPISEINDVRRRAVAALEALRLQNYKRPPSRPSIKIFAAPPDENANIATSAAKMTGTPMLVVHVDDLAKAEAAAHAGADALLFGGNAPSNAPLSLNDYLCAVKIVRKYGAKIYFSTPRITGANAAFTEEILRCGNDCDGIYVHNIGVFRTAKSLTTAPICIDWSLVAGNGETLRFWQKNGAAAVTLSPELTLAQIKTLAARNCLPLECIIDGRQELMLTKFCALGSYLTKPPQENCDARCKCGEFFLKDRKGVMFPIIVDQFCQMHILNGKSLSLLVHAGEFKNIANVQRLRIDARHETSVGTVKKIRAYKAAIAGKTAAEEDAENITRGHYFRGVE